MRLNPASESYFHGDPILLYGFLIIHKIDCGPKSFSYLSFTKYFNTIHGTWFHNVIRNIVPDITITDYHIPQLR